jgi:hypothetical protein
MMHRDLATSNWLSTQDGDSLSLGRLYDYYVRVSQEVTQHQ